MIDASDASQLVLTVITPVFNGERYIAACIESVAAQDCPGIEHIVVDGASKDRTAEIVREYAASMPHLRLISEPDKGQSDALNKGLMAARADYVSILNVDDFYAPGTLGRIVALIPTLREPHFIYGNCNVLSEGDVLYRLNRPGILRFENIVVDSNTWPYPYNPSAYFYPRAVHDAVGYYDLDEHFGMDLKFILAAIQEIEPLYIDEVLGNFRFIPGTKSFGTVVDGTDLRIQHKIFRDAFRRAPLRTKLRVISLWLSHKPKLAYWELRRSLKRVAARQA